MATTRATLSPTDFSIEKANSFLFITDWEPEDVMCVLGFLRYIAKKYNRKVPPIAFVSGGANAAIQNARGKEWLQLCQQEGWFPKNANLKFIQGMNSEKKFNKQETEILSDNEIKSVNTDLANPGFDISEIKNFLKNHPETMVFSFKRPDEMLGDNELLALLSRATLICYSEDLDINAANLEKFYEAFAKVAIANNASMLQNKDASVICQIDKSNTPRFVETLLNTDTLTARELKKNIATKCQTVITTQLTLIAAIYPEKITESIVGQNDKHLTLGRIEGGKAECLKNVDDALCEIIFGLSPRQKIMESHKARLSFSFGITSSKPVIPINETTIYNNNGGHLTNTK